jgi:hypothetical protein
MNTALAIFLLTVCMSNNNDQLLFDGKTLNHWEIIDYDGHGDVYVADSTIFINRGKVISGIRWTADFPVTNYEVSLYARRVEGNDFFCGLTFPVKDSFLHWYLEDGADLYQDSVASTELMRPQYHATNFYFGKGLVGCPPQGNR